MSGKRMVGRICLALTILDAGDAPAAVGDQVVVLGPGRSEQASMADPTPTVDDWARSAGTIPHEILTGIGPRVERRYVRWDP